MDVVVSRCAGIGIGKAEVVVCLRVPGSRGKRVSEVGTFSAARVPKAMSRWVEKPSRHAEVLSKYPGESCQSSLHLDTCT